MQPSSKMLNLLLAPLSQRQKDVIIGRFGLDKPGEIMTLAAIGDKMQITRERVRQIEKSALELVKKEVANQPASKRVLEASVKQLKAAGGIMKKDLLLKKIGGAAQGLDENQLALLIEASGAFHAYPENDDYSSFYYLSREDLKNAMNFVGAWTDFLEKEKGAVLAGSYESNLKDFIRRKRADGAFADNCLGISKKILSNSWGDMGLREWAEIRPATTRDRAYLILKKKKAPMHFTEIAGEINNARLSAQTALAPTVHNELIKDERFVLVGRGMYALKEHGYEPGIAREVIHKVLKHEGPLRAQDVIAHVQKQRLFKPNTILINLQNKDFFERTSDGRYRVRES